MPHDNNNKTMSRIERNLGNKQKHDHDNLFGGSDHLFDDAYELLFENKVCQTTVVLLLCPPLSR